MHRRLLRQLRRICGIDSEAELQKLLEALPIFAADSNTIPEARSFFTKVGDLLSHVDSTYEQSDRDLDLRSRSLDISSRELSSQNIQLQAEIDQRKRAEVFRIEQGRVLEMIATSVPLEEILANLANLVEAQFSGLSCSILLLDKEGKHLNHGVAPSLPSTYNNAIDGMLIGPEVGSCGTACYRKEMVVVSDILTDPLWKDFRQIARDHDLRACWSTPILSHQNTVLGTFAIYAREVHVPAVEEIQLVALATHIAGIAIERKRTEERIRHMAHHDSLTGLANRSLLEDRLQQAILYAQRYNRSVTVAFIDLDNFKLINDSLGHSVGDELLKVVAERMSSSVRKTDTVVRLGGDEFVIVLFDQPEKSGSIIPILDNLYRVLWEPIHIGETSLQITCSMGVASYPEDGTDADTLLMHADAAMYRAKEHGRNNYQFFTAEMNAKVHEKFTLQEGLRTALAKDEFILLYQPQVDLRSGKIIGVEALIRWRHPTRGMVSPTEFIPVAEESGLIVPIGDWVLHTACRQNKAWQDMGLPPLTMSINVSARQFREKNLIGQIALALHDTGLDPQYLELELTESLIMQNLQKAITTMGQLKDMGVLLSIDDFGTGYSSLTALKSFPIARLKIDQSFVRDIPNDEDDKAIAAVVITLGHKLNLKVIAEGVETEAQRQFLLENGCDEMQGYLFSKPVTADEIETFFSATELRRKIG